MIYFIQDTVNKFIKIGKTVGLNNRLSSTQVGNPNILVCLNVIENEVDDSVYHERFKHCHHRAEWFSPAPDLMEFISSLPQVNIQSLLCKPWNLNRRR